MKKKLLSILLSLAMVLTMIPFATMTAFADEPITSISVTVPELTVEELQKLGSETEPKMTVTMTTPTDEVSFLNQHTGFNGCHLYDSSNNPLFTYYEGYWHDDNDEYWKTVGTPDFDNVAKVIIQNNIDLMYVDGCESFFNSLTTVNLNDKPIKTSDEASDNESYYSGYNSAFSVLFVYELEKPSSKCISYKAVKDFTKGNALKINTKDVGDFAFEAVDGGWNIQDVDGNYLGVDNYGKLTRSKCKKTVWTYKNHSFSTKYTKQIKWYLPAVKKTAYLSRDKDNKVTTSCVYALAEVCKKTVREHHLNALFLKKDGEHHVAICARCGAKTEQEHCYGKLTKRCICGAKKSKVETKTLAELMKDFPSDFENGWVKNGDTTRKMYYADDYLTLQTEGYQTTQVLVGATDEFTKEGNNYKYVKSGEGWSYTVTLFMKGNDITSIVFEANGFTDPYAGTYNPQPE